ncbi:hypothetical protein SAMN05216389_13813 [Oceanobacillus limi]|uniref:Uncharacterized protein n=1 Tax=Oceanobacillus limi TaxID=930131 RepID=A0A1I0HKQ9_9BACI|nr:hypothetical protein [Oceanobacillus limi]SET84466.1 hypothetical protein SAMN05216389_13813 [Oceanobacillus limi]
MNAPKLEANKVIDELTHRMALLEKENAMLAVQLRGMQEENRKYKDLVDAYENKEKVENATE